MSSVMERPQHPGNINESTTFQPAFTYWPGRFTFEIEHDKILPGKKQLAKMIISMNTDFFDVDRITQQVVVAGIENVCAIENLLSESLAIVIERRDRARQQRHRLFGFTSNRLKHGSLMLERERLGRKIG